MITAAHEVFLAHGYGGATVDLIAERAGVSRPTVFAVGSKAQLFALARDVAMAGDDQPTPVRDRPSFQSALGEPDPVKALRGFARHVAAVAERYGALDEVLREGAGREPALLELWQQSESQRREGARLFVEGLRRNGAQLRQAPERTTDVLWLLMAPDHHRRLTAGRSWSSAAYARWLGDAMVSLVLAQSER